MMSDDEILSVVQAHKEGKKIEWRFQNSYEWLEVKECPVWNFGVAQYRVVREPRKPIDIWLQECGGGMWQQKWDGVGQHFREVID